MDELAAVLVAARDEERTIGRTVSALKEAFPGAEVIVADDGSRDGTADEAERAGARVVRLPRLGKGQALTLGEAEAPAGSCSSATQTWAATCARWPSRELIWPSPSSPRSRAVASASPSRPAAL